MPDATIQLASPHGAWRPVYARRLALHRTADDVIAAAWAADTADLILARPAHWWAAESASPDDREAAAAAVLAVLAATDFTRTRTVIRTAAIRAHRAGYAAGRHLTDADPGDDSDYDEDAVSGADLTDTQADLTAAATLTTALTATARHAGRILADTDSPDAATAAARSGRSMAVAADVAVSAAYGLGQLSAYHAAGRQSVLWLSAGDGRVCTACSDAEAGSPYPLLATPMLPQHPNCRCCLAPA
ncbi:hypothetical protein ACFYUY_01350 [Kitasatospora sp. NPDC004745]|uniref:hypothetical protein n=1 Tax=Kitasatospora sp. NPDC004745 TaxID=3364019 RepID=UPI0036888A49